MIRAFSDAVQQIIQIDTQLTELMRVSNGQENINKVLSESIRLADELGNKVSQVNEAIIGFSRQGFRGDDLIAISEVATLMSNVSTLSLEESMSGVTAAMKVFNITAEDSIRIVNALNEVDELLSLISVMV
jgi:TP901 family phage tail tape measure protein